MHSVHHHDGTVGHIVAVQSLDSFIVPVFDLAREDFRQKTPVELEFADLAVVVVLAYGVALKV